MMTEQEQERLLEKLRDVLKEIMAGGISSMDAEPGRIAMHEANEGNGDVRIKLAPLTFSYIVRVDDALVGFELSSPTKRLRLVEPGRSN